MPQPRPYGPNDRRDPSTSGRPPLPLISPVPTPGTVVVAP
jgi:hypothetical protein